MDKDVSEGPQKVVLGPVIGTLNRTTIHQWVLGLRPPRFVVFDGAATEQDCCHYAKLTSGIDSAQEVGFYIIHGQKFIDKTGSDEHLQVLFKTKLDGKT